jgi:hypothetical protein
MLSLKFVLNIQRPTFARPSRADREHADNQRVKKRQGMQYRMA